MPSYFNIFECGSNLLNRLDVRYERACMATPSDKYYTKTLETLVAYNDHHNAPMSNDKIRQAISTVMSETEEGKNDAKRNANNMTMDTFYQSPVTNNTQGKIANVPNERQVASNILAEMIKYLKD